MAEDTPRSGKSLVSEMLKGVREIGSNLAYIRQELPDVELPEERRHGFLEICETLSNEVDGLRSPIERLEGGPQPGAVIDSILAAMRGQATRLDEWVTAARALAAAEPRCVAVQILLEESGGNMLQAYVRIWHDLEALRAPD